MAGCCGNRSMYRIEEEAGRESTPRLNETSKPATVKATSEAVKSVKEASGVEEEELLPSQPSPAHVDDEGEEPAVVCVEHDFPASRSKLEIRSRPLTTFEDAMKLPYNQDCLKPLFGPGMSERAWDSGKFNIELHCTDPWMKKNWRRCRNMCKGGREGGVKFNQLRRNFMRMLWFERKGIRIDWETVDVSSRLVSEQRGTREPTNAEASDLNSRKKLREERRRRRQHGISPTAKALLAKALLAGGKRGADGQQGAVIVGNDEDDNRRNALVGICALQEAGLTIVKQDDLTRMRNEGSRDRKEIVRLNTELETERCLRIATDASRQDDLTTMRSEGCHDREEIVRLKTELETERCQRIAAEVSRTEVLSTQTSDLQKIRNRNAVALSCSLCQDDLAVLPTVRLGFCKCQFHVHCFWKYFAANGVCICRKPFPELLYTYFGRLAQVGTRTGLSQGHAGQRVQKDTLIEDSRAGAEIQRVKNVVRELLREWHVAGGRNGWHLHNLSDTMRMRFDAFHADLQRRAQLLAGTEAREAFLSYTNKFGLNTGNFTMLYPGLDIPEEIVDLHFAGGSYFSDKSGSQAKGPYGNEDREEDDEYRRKMEMIIRATSVPSDQEARSEIEDSTAGFPKRRRK